MPRHMTVVQKRAPFSAAWPGGREARGGRVDEISLPAGDVGIVTFTGRVVAMNAGLAIGFVIYLGYGPHHARLARPR